MKSASPPSPARAALAPVQPDYARFRASGIES
jgi:hypothetical protein